MRFVRPLVASMVLIAVAGGAYAFAEGPATKPAKAPKLVQPWSKVKDLSDDQKVQISAIHSDMVAKQKAIEADAKAKILALLTPEQKAQLDATLAEESAARKAKQANKDKEDEPATKPSM
jgi:hypothetical protein